MTILQMFGWESVNITIFTQFQSRYNPIHKLLSNCCVLCLSDGQTMIVRTWPHEVLFYWFSFARVVTWVWCLEGHCKLVCNNTGIGDQPEYIILFTISNCERQQLKSSEWEPGNTSYLVFPPIAVFGIYNMSAFVQCQNGRYKRVLWGSCSLKDNFVDFS